MPRKVEIIPTDDAVLNQTIAGLCDLLFFLFGLKIFTWVSNCHGAGKAV